jgi:hypothetical protein
MSDQTVKAAGSNKVKGFSCASCVHLRRNYIGDGFDEFYEWLCGAMDNKEISCVDTFDPTPPLPELCPVMKQTLLDIKKAKAEKKRKK